MRIEDVRIAEYRVPLAAGDARRNWTERRGLLLTLRDEDGRIGQGEASPLPGYSPDTLEESRAALETLAATRRPDLDLQSKPAPPSAMFAWTTAVLDLRGQRSGRSLASLLGNPALSIPLAALLAGGSREAILASARAAVARGVRTLKIKLQHDLAGQMPLLRAIRQEMGDTVEIRFDANGCWDVALARASLAALADLRPEFVEDPVSPALWPDLGPVPVPLAVDEALGTAHEAAALSAPGVLVAVLKPSRLGDVSRISRTGFDVVVGHMYEGPVAMAAAAEMALSLPRVRACGLDRHEALSAWDVAPPQLEPDRIVSVGPGLGLPRLRLPGALG